MKYLLDTNICIYLIKRSPDQVYDKFKTLRVGDIGVSAITLCELQYGVAHSSMPERNQMALTKFLSPIEVLDFPSEAAMMYGEIRAHLKREGALIGSYDLLIAAHALCGHLTLVTNNTKEFCRVPSLSLENWAEPGPQPVRRRKG